MKKGFGLLFVAGLLAFASCNNAEDATTDVNTMDESVVTKDTTTLEADTTIAPIDTAAAVE